MNKFGHEIIMTKKCRKIIALYILPICASSILWPTVARKATNIILTI